MGENCREGYDFSVYELSWLGIVRVGIILVGILLVGIVHGGIIRVGIVLRGNCHGWKLSLVGIFLVGNCTGRICAVGNCPCGNFYCGNSHGWELSLVVVVRLRILLLLNVLSTQCPDLDHRGFSHSRPGGRIGIADPHPSLYLFRNSNCNTFDAYSESNSNGFSMIARYLFKV